MPMSNESRSYQGWPSYETWLTYTWLSNDPLLDETCMMLAKSATSPTCAADTIEEFVEEHLPALEEASLESDLLRAALYHVDWRCLAERYAQI
jgi:hypothetical protein